LRRGFIGDHRNCEQDAARSIKRICVGQPTNDAGSTQLVWRGVVVKTTLVEARMFSDTEAIILASAILGVALLALM
jgi:hypothetical protein